MAIAIMRNSQGNASVRTRMYVFGFLYFWYIPVDQSCNRLHEAYMIGMRCGDVDSAVYALGLSWQVQFYRGMKLEALNALYEEVIRIVVSTSNENESLDGFIY